MYLDQVKLVAVCVGNCVTFTMYQNRRRKSWLCSLHSPETHIQRNGHLQSWIKYIKKAAKQATRLVIASMHTSSRNTYSWQTRQKLSLDKRCISRYAPKVRHFRHEFHIKGHKTLIMIMQIVAAVSQVIQSTLETIPSSGTCQAESLGRVAGMWSDSAWCPHLWHTGSQQHSLTVIVLGRLHETQPASNAALHCSWSLLWFLRDLQQQKLQLAKQRLGPWVLRPPYRFVNCPFSW